MLQVKVPESIITLYDFLFDMKTGNPRVNIAEDLTEEELIEIGTRVYEEYEIDKKSREDWEKQQEEIFEIAEAVTNMKATPGKADVKYPILATAALQFSARAYPNIVKGSDVVKCQVIGSDIGGIKAAKGERVKQHMSFQVLEQMDSWEEEMDQLLMNYSLCGCNFKKTYYDPIERKPASELVFARDLVIHYMAVFEKARRMTHIIELYPNEIEERIRSGVFLDFDYEKETASRKEDTNTDDVGDSDLPHTFLEQHRFWDLDGDGYAEPYVMTIHRESQKVVRVLPRFDVNGIILNENQEIARIIPIQYFTRFLFMPAFDGNVYGMGFGSLLFAPVNIVNTIFNQLLDAGTLANRQGGFLGPGIKLKAGGGHGVLTFQQGEWKQVSFMGDDIRRQVFALPVKEPSNVLFQLLGLMLDAVKELASQSEILSGEHPKGNVPATTTLALIEQGLKVFSAVYKRVYNGLKSEFGKIRRLNTIYLSVEEYNNIIDYTDIAPVIDPNTGQPVIDPQSGEPIQQEQRIIVDPKQDYGEMWMDIIPVSGSADVSDTQRTIKAQALLELRGQGLNDDAINKRYLEALQVPDINELLPDPNTPPPIDPKIEIEGKKLELKAMELEIEARRQMAEEKEKMGKIMQYWANSIKLLAEAEGVEAGSQIDLYKNELKYIADDVKSYRTMIGQLESSRAQKENKQQTQKASK